MPDTPTEWLARYSELLRALGPRSPVVEQLLAKLIPVGGEVAAEAIRLIKEALDQSPPPAPPVAAVPAGAPAAPPQAPLPQADPAAQRSRFARWAHDLLEVFSTQTGKNSLIGLVVAAMTVLGVNSVTPTSRDVSAVRENQDEKFNDVTKRLDGLESKSNERAVKFFAPDSFAESVKAAADATDLPPDVKKKLPEQARKLGPKLLEQWNKK